MPWIKVSVYETHVASYLLEVSDVNFERYEDGGQFTFDIVDSAINHGAPLDGETYYLETEGLKSIEVIHADSREYSDYSDIIEGHE